MNTGSAEMGCRCYRLAFGDCFSWTFSADREMQDWLDRFARLCRLPEAGYSGGTVAVHCRRFAGKEDTKLEEWHGYDAAAGLWVDRFCQVQMTRVCSNSLIVDVVFNREPGIEIIGMLELFYLLYASVMNRGGLPFHAALAEYGGRAYLLAGQSGQGKSTCSKRLQDVGGGWRSLCDDEVLVRFDGVKGYYAHPVPTWSDFMFDKQSPRCWSVGEGYPLSGLFLLDHGSVDRLVPVERSAERVSAVVESSRQIWLRYFRDDTAMRRKAFGQLFDNACTLASQVPVYRFSVSLGGMFWQELEKVACNENK